VIDLKYRGQLICSKIWSALVTLPKIILFTFLLPKQISRLPSKQYVKWEIISIGLAWHQLREWKQFLKK